jgi:hypothetical protein
MMRVLWLSLFLVSCTHQPLKIPEGGGIYPYGTYQHNVKVMTKAPARTMEMRGVVSYRADGIKVVGLSTFGTTIFRISEDSKTGEIEKEFYLDIVRQHEDQFMNFYHLIRELVTAPKGQTDFVRGDAHFVLSKPDENGIYRRIHVEHPQFILDIEVAKYDF